MGKIVQLPDLENVRGILVHGCFDGLHIGHVRLIGQAAALLPQAPVIASITADSFMVKRRPVFPEDVRAEWLSALGAVDYVTIVREKTGLLAIEIIKPHIYAKGAGDDKLPEEEEAVLRHGGSFFRISKERDAGGTVYSSSLLLGGRLA